MRRRRLLSLLLCMILLGSAAGAEGVTLRIVTCFAGDDPATEAYVEILRQYEAESGNQVEDDSTTSDEAWKTAVLNDFAAGNEPDVLFFFAAGGDSQPLLSRVVPIAEINEAYPALNLPEVEALREPDGQVYAVPTHGYWEGLYVRTDLFERYGAPLPTDWESLVEAVRIFRENGIVPIAASLSDIPHYVAEMALLACATEEELRTRPATLAEVPESWLQAMDLIRELYEMGAFPEDTLATYDGAATELFASGKAAMRLDGSWMADSLPPAMMDVLAVLPMPLREGEGAARCYIGGMSMGFYLCRRSWENAARRDEAVSLLAALTSEESLNKLSNSHIQGKMLLSVLEMETGRAMVSPLQDAMNRAARETWLLECIPAVAEGSMSAAECWERVMSLRPFGE